MLSVMFGALPKKVDKDDHLHNARMLRPELEQEEEFVDDMLHERAQGGPDPVVVECRSENSLVRWRTRERRLEETEVGTGMAITLINALRSVEWRQTTNRYHFSECLGLTCGRPNPRHATASTRC
jgi:hypothetical protein